MSSLQDRVDRRKAQDEEKKQDKAFQRWRKRYAKGTYKGVPSVGSLDSAADAEVSNSVGDSDPDMWSSGPPWGARDTKAGRLAGGTAMGNAPQRVSGGAYASCGAHPIVGEDRDVRTMDDDPVAEMIPDELDELDEYREKLASCMQLSAGDMLPTLHVSQKCGFEVVACALPKTKDLNLEYVSMELNMAQFCVAGFGGITDESGNQVFVPFCNCCAQSVKAFNALESQHFMSHSPGVCEEIVALGATCMHANAVMKFAIDFGGASLVLKRCLNKCDTANHGIESSAGSSTTTSKTIPVFDLGVMTITKARQSKMLKQVGYFAHCEDAFNLGIVTHNDQQTACTLCGGSRCMHTRAVKEPVLADVNDRDRDELRGMGKDAFESMCARMLNDDKSALKLHCVSHKTIPFHPGDYSPSLAKARFSRLANLPVSEWTACDGVGNLILRDEVEADCGYSEPENETQDAFLFCANGVLCDVTVQSRFDGDDNKVPFDGRDLGILNFNNTILFTHEFLHEFLDLSCNNRVSHRGYIRTKVEGWTRSLLTVQSDPDHEKKRSKCLDFILRPSLANTITDAIFDYLTLLDIDYESLFSCKCRLGLRKHLTVIYDNSCGFLRFLLLRLPALAQQITCVIDQVHYSSHKNCSPYYNHAFITSVQNLNAELNEQKNRILNYMKTSISQVSFILTL